MINEENLNKLYEGIVNDNELTTKQLNNYGFNSKDISDLIEQGILERVKRGYYSFKSINDLFYYGKRLIAEKEYEKATECFEKCYELDPNHSGVCFQLFLRSISKKDYEQAFKYYEILSNTDNPYYNADTNFYLYLLSIITNIPEKHKEYARYLKFEDIRVDFSDKRYEDIPEQNKIRIAVLQRKFPYALKQLKELTAEHEVLTVQDIITRTLLFQAAEAETTSKKTIIELAKNKSYQEIQKYLEEKQNQHNLSISDDYILKLVNEIVNIQETHHIPEKIIFESEKVFEAIDGNNYELALHLSESYNNQNNINNSENIIYLLLSDICNLIKKQSLTTQKTVSAVEEATEIEIEDETLYEEQISSSNNSVSNASISDIISYLMKADLENAFRALRNYLESINKKDYEFLIVNLIKLSLIEKDIAFTKPMIALAYISRESFKFDISSYIQEFYVTLSQNKFDEARIYLDIISKSNNLGQDCILTDGLLQVLNAAENMIEYKRNNTVLDNVENALLQSKNPQIVPQSNTPVKRKQSNPEVELPKENIVINSNFVVTMNNEKEFLENKHELLLKEKGIVLLKPMDYEARNKIHEMVKEYDDMICFNIGEGENKQIVLRYKPFIDGYIDIKSLINMANSAYKEGDYDSCINNYLQVLQFGQPKSFVYAYIGLSYMRKGNKEKAIDYLTVATELNKQEQGTYDYTDIIAKLNGIKPQERKAYFKMKVEEFENDTQNYYGIENFEEITEYIIENGLDVESACKEFGMTGEQIDIVRLIYAREYYSQGIFEKGDQFLMSVEQSKNKTEFTAKLFDEIRRNKKFYINRVDENTRHLALTIEPKK